jgi:antitoxin Phd
MYNQYMKLFALSEANHDLSMLVDKAAEEPILITRQGEDAAVVISPSLYQEMTEVLENHEDIAAYDDAKARKEDSVLWQDARKDLGLV